MIVMKFGGTSVGDAKMIRNTASVVLRMKDRKPVVVVSAVSGITNQLIELAKSAPEKMAEIYEAIKLRHIGIMKELGTTSGLLDNDLMGLKACADRIAGEGLNKETLDEMQSFGERMSTKIVAFEISRHGLKADAVNSFEIGLLTDENFGNAEPLEEAYALLGKHIRAMDSVPVVTGFLGKTRKGEITTLGRGGSDYSAAIVGAAIDAEEIQIWTDVNGIMSTDPKMVASAKTIESVSFAEAAELAYFGAKVLHPKTIKPAMAKNIPVKVLNTFEPENKGTTIAKDPSNGKSIVKAIAYKKSSTLIIIQSTRMLGAYGFLSRLFRVFEKYRKSVDVISTSEVSVSLTIDSDENLESILEELESIADIKVLEGRTVISIVGEGMKSTPGISARTFSAIARQKVNIEMISQGASEINLTFVVDGSSTETAVKALHKEFFGE